MGGLEKEKLDYAIEHSIIDISYVQEKIEMHKKQELLKKHPYSIKCSEKDGFWRTYLPNKEKGRVQIKRKNLADLEKIVIDFWKEESENPTVKELYNEWINDKLDREEISYATKNRYDRQFDECMGKFAERKIKNITSYDIEEFVLNTIHEHSLTQKGYSNMRTLIYGIFRRAKKKGYVSYSITEVVQDMELSKKIFRKNVKSDEQLVFMEDEVSKIVDYIMNNKLDLISLGILLFFKTGLRAGELAGLERNDIKENVIHICRTEIRYSTEVQKNIYEVRDFPKTEAGIRDVILPDKYIWILKEIRRLNPFGKYLFEKDGERIKTYQFSQRLETICKHTGIAKKSLNKIRKTYASILIDSNVTESVITSQLGHTDIKTTKSYYYKDRRNLEQKTIIINGVIGL